MTAPAPCGAPQTDPRVLPGYQGDDEHREDSALHPDVLAYADQLVGEVTPYRLRWLQRQAQQLLNIGGIRSSTNIALLQQLDDLCISRNLSPGGSADLLILTWFLSHFTQE